MTAAFRLRFDLEAGEGIAYFIAQAPEGQKGERSGYSDAGDAPIDKALRR